MLQQNGFTELRLSPYHCDFNAIKYVCGRKIFFIKKHNVTQAFCIQNYLPIQTKLLKMSLSNNEH